MACTDMGAISMSMDLVMLRDLSNEEVGIFQFQYNEVRKSEVAGFLMAFFLGGIGGHRFYMGQVGLGFLYLLFFWTLIPGLCAFVEMFLMPGRVRRHNEARAAEIVMKLRASRNGQTASRVPEANQTVGPPEW
jgi:TM2 domain-containing membrane protein YozV